MNQDASKKASEDHHHSQPEHSLTRRVLKGFFWTFTGTGAEFVLQIGFLLLLARFVSPKEFGVVGAALVVVNFSAIFSQLGIGSALVQHPNLEARHIRTGYTVSLLFGVLLMLIVILLAPLITAFFQMQELTNILIVLSIVFPLWGRKAVIVAR